MLHAIQPWLPLLEAETPPPARRPKPRASATTSDPISPQRLADSRQARLLRWAFLEIARNWALSATEALTLLGEPTADEAERLARLNGLLGANRSLLLLAPEPPRRAELLRRADPRLGGASVLEVLLRDGRPGLARVRAHLVAQLRP